MPSPGGELYVSVSLLISALIQCSLKEGLTKKHQTRSPADTHLSLGDRDRALNTWGIEPLGLFLSVKYWKTGKKKKNCCSECAFMWYSQMRCSWKILCHCYFFFLFYLRHGLKNVLVSRQLYYVEAEAHNQLTNPFQLWPINKVSLWRIDCKQNAVGRYPVDVTFLTDREKLLFVSTIYYLYTCLYCDSVVGRATPLQSCSHLHREGKHNPRLRAHTKVLTSHSNLSPSFSHDYKSCIQVC